LANLDLKIVETLHEGVDAPGIDLLAPFSPMYQHPQVACRAIPPTLHAKELDLELALAEGGLRLLAESLELVVEPVKQSGLVHGDSSEANKKGPGELAAAPRDLPEDQHDDLPYDAAASAAG
jgi:hypothetical protein